jgi:type I restriction enzyme, S subunit
MKSHPVNPVHPVGTPWPTVRLGEVLRRREPDVKVEAAMSYQFAGVYSFGRGVFRGQERTGSQFSYQRLSRLRTGDFTYPKLMAWEGAFGVVPPECDGCYVSPEFPVFTPRADRIASDFLGFYFRIPRVWKDVSGGSIGTNVRRRRLHPDDFLRAEIPLPPLAEQRWVVAQIEGLAAQIEEARTLREAIEGELNAMLTSAHRQIASSAPRRPLAEVAPLCRRPVTIEIGKSYPQIAVRSFGRGTFHKPPLAGSDVTWEKLFLVKTGDILVSNIKAWEGALAVADPEDDGRVGSHRYLTCVPIEGAATARFVCFHLLGPEGLHAVGEASPGSADRNRTLSAKAFLRIPVPVPAYAEQLWFDSLWREVDTLKRLQAETAAELDALLPAILDRAFKGEL